MIKEKFGQFMGGYHKKYMWHDLAFVVMLGIIISILAFGLISHDNFLQWLKDHKNSIYSLIATISGTLLGFIITGISIILLFVQSNKLEFLIQNKQYKTIYTVYFSTFKYLAITTIIAIIGLLFGDNDYKISFGLFVLLVVFSFISSARLYRCIWVLEGIVDIYINNIKDDKAKPNDGSKSASVI